jgi:rod shape determining protein RodA
MERFAVGMALMIGLGFVPIWFWRGISVGAYIVCVLLLVAVDVIGHVGMGAQRWLDMARSSCNRPS